MSNSELIHEVYNNHNNDTEIILELAYRYSLGRRGMSQDISRAVALYERLVERGSIRAIRAMGLLYQVGYGVNKDLSRAGELYEQGLNIAIRQIAEEKQDSKDFFDLRMILNYLFQLHEKGKYSSSESLFDKGLFLYQKSYENEGQNNRAKLYEKAQAGDIESLLRLSGNDWPVLIEDRFVLMKAAELGSVEAMVKLANAYRVSYTPRSKYTMEQAIALYKQAAKQGSVEATEALADIYHYGGVKYGYTDTGRKNFHLARTFYITAAELGGFEAIRTLVDVYENGGLGMKPNSEKASKYYAMILDQEKEKTIAIWWEKSLLKLKEKSITRLRELASSGSAEANYQLGRFYRDGLRGYESHQGLPANSVLAALFFERALEKGHEKAGEALRQLVPEDLSKVNAFVCRAAFAGG